MPKKCPNCGNKVSLLQIIKYFNNIESNETRCNKCNINLTNNNFSKKYYIGFIITFSLLIMFILNTFLFPRFFGLSFNNYLFIISHLIFVAILLFFTFPVKKK